MANSDLRAPMREHRYQRWVAIALGCVLLLFAQAMASAKTLLEQYLNCDGIEEIVFYLEYPGQTNDFPTTYSCGSYQSDNFLLIQSPTPINSIPQKLEREPTLDIRCRFNKVWWVVNTSMYFYDCKIWEEKGIPEEENNEVELTCIPSLNTLYANVLNFGLGHSATNMNPSGGKYENNDATISVDYLISEKNNSGLPLTIVAHVVDKLERFFPVTWRNQIDYLTNKNELVVPCSITRYGNGKSFSKEGKEMLLDRIVITQLVPAKQALPREHFLRPAFENTEAFSDLKPIKYHLQTNQFVGLDSKSNRVVRLEPDDPRILKTTDNKKLLIGYWISAALIASLAILFFVWGRRKE